MDSLAQQLGTNFTGGLRRATGCILQLNKGGRPVSRWFEDDEDEDDDEDEEAS